MFVASDVVEEETSEDGSTNRVERRCALDVDAPRLLKRVRCTPGRPLKNNALWLPGLMSIENFFFFLF